MSSDKKKGSVKWLIAVGVIAFSIWLYEEVIEEYVIPDLFPLRWGCVEEGSLYRSGQLSAALVEKTLKKNEIAVVIALNGEHAAHRDHEAEMRAVASLGLEFHRFPLKGDGTGDIAMYAEAIKTIVRAQAEEKPTQVHCAAGVLRSGGVLACYKLLVKGESPDQIRRHLKDYGWRAEKDKKLLPFINANMNRLTELLLAEGVISSIPNPLPTL
ncbi:MAG: dual specificity protein phosphatase family protein [Planctomycetes bacterium]|nr:dual specificity protein phosphatase family protein [Planctomycetota bacterium]